MRCEKCQSRGYIYCFHYPHATPVVRIESHTETVQVTTFEVKGVRM